MNRIKVPAPPPGTTEKNNISQKFLNLRSPLNQKLFSNYLDISEMVKYADF